MQLSFEIISTAEQKTKSSVEIILKKEKNIYK